MIPDQNKDVKVHSKVLEQNIGRIHFVQVLVPIDQEVLMLPAEDLAHRRQGSNSIGRMDQSTIQPVGGDQLIDPSIQN